MTFWLILSGMTLIALAVAHWPLALASSSKQEANGEMAFYAAQLAEIDRDVDRGLLPSQEAAAARAETARRLLAARAQVGHASGRDSVLRRGLACAIGFAAIVGIGAGVYGALGSPAVADQPLAERKENPHQDDPVFKAIAKIEEEVAVSPNNVRRGRCWRRPIFALVGMQIQCSPIAS